jgi:aryl-alcohol dehydrogenase (NADP+)
MNFGDSTDEAEGIKLVHAAIDMGINFMDTADVYWKGKSEQILGKAIKGRREGLVIATKCWAPFDEGPNDRGSSRYHIMQAAEGALERLGVDCIDLFIMHRPDEVLPGLQEDPTPMDETLRALSDLVRQGKVRYIGTSCYPACYGWLSGKYHRGQEPPADSRAARKFKITVSSPDADRNFTIIEDLAPIAKSLGVPMSQFSLAWVLANPAITSVICGPRILAHLEDNAKALDVELDQETLDAVDRIVPPGSGKDNEYGDVMVVPVA